MAQLQLLNLKGLRNRLGSAVAHPTVPGAILYVSAAQVVITDEADCTRQAFLRGHAGPITAFALSPRGTFVATGSAGYKDADVVLWNYSTRQPLTRFCEHDHEIVSLAFSYDDRLLMTAGHEEKDQRLFVLDTSTGKIVTKASLEFRKRITASAWSPVTRPNAYDFATASDNEIILWTVDPYSGAISQRKVVTGSVRRSFTGLVFAAGGDWLYAGTTTGDILTVNVQRAAIQLTHPACAGGVGGMVLSSTGRLLVGGGDGSITMFSNDHMWRDMRPFVKVPGSVHSLSTNSDGSALIVGTTQGALLRVASGTFNISVLSEHHTQGVTRIAFQGRDPTAYASSSANGTVCLWDAKGQRLIGQASAGPAAGPALALALTPTHVVTGWGDGCIRAHTRDLAVAGYLQQLQAVSVNPLMHPEKARAAAAAAAAAAAVSIGGAPLLAQSWIVPGAHSLAHSQGVHALAIAHRGHFIASGGAGGEIRLWDTGSREMVAHMKQHTLPVNEITVLADDAHLLSVSDDRSMLVWDLGSQKSRASWRTATAIKGVAAAPDQVTLATVGLEGFVTLWDMRAPDPVYLLHAAHEGQIGAVAISPDGVLMATGGTDTSVKVWDLRAPPPPPAPTRGKPGPPSSSGNLVAVGTAHTAALSTMAFDPTGARLVSGAVDGSTAMWALQAAGAHGCVAGSAMLTLTQPGMMPGLIRGIHSWQELGL